MINFLKHKFHNLISDKKFSEILTGTVWAMGSRVISTGIAMIISIIIARVYGAEVMGVVAMLNSFFMLVTIFTVLGTNTSILRLIPEHITKYSITSSYNVYRKILYLVAVISVTTGCIIYFGSSLISIKVFAKPQLTVFFSLSSVFIVFKSLMIFNTQAIRGLRLIRTFAFMQLLPSLSNLIILTLLTYLIFNQYNPVYAFFFSFMITALIGILIIDRSFKNNSKLSDRVHAMTVKKILGISFPMLMSTTMAFAIGQTGVIMLGIFRNEAEVGYYDLAVKLSTLTAFVLQSINSMAGSKFSELYNAGKMDELFHVAKKSSKLIFWITMPILCTLIVFGKFIITFLYGKEFSVAYLPMVYLVIGQFLNVISGSNACFMNMTGDEMKLRNILITTAVITILLGYWVIPIYGINGAAIVGMFSYIFWNVYALIYIKLKYGVMIGYIPIIS
ncbi:MAG: flippase [Desulfobacterales bacterium]|nr:flippase [Desulfobacterales bacterium]